MPAQSSIDTLDLRDPLVVERARQDADLDAQGLWYPWDECFSVEAHVIPTYMPDPRDWAWQPPLRYRLMRAWLLYRVYVFAWIAVIIFIVIELWR